MLLTSKIKIQDTPQENPIILNVLELYGENLRSSFFESVCINQEDIKPNNIKIEDIMFIIFYFNYNTFYMICQNFSKNIF